MGTGSWMADMMKGIVVFVSIQAVTVPNKKRENKNWPGQFGSSSPALRPGQYDLNMCCRRPSVFKCS